jgi:carboxypeptidase C (cathepsin A)
MDGFFYEMGPFHFVEPHPKNDTPKLILNPYAWTTQSNMIFLEAPACVGLSYADTPQGCRNNDTQQAIDNLSALRAWYRGFPEYRNNGLYITGTTYDLCLESYLYFIHSAHSLPVLFVCHK